MAQALGTGVLVATVDGSGIMADRLTDDPARTARKHGAHRRDPGVLIAILNSLSGAHFNPAVTLAFALRRDMTASAALAYAAVQLEVLRERCWRRPCSSCRSGRPRRR